MAIARWTPRQAVTPQEARLLARLGRVRKLLAFLRQYRHELFDDAFQGELATRYRDTGAGKPPLPPALLAMAGLVQGYLRVSDAERVELTVVDLRVQLVLDRLGTTEPAFSQGALAAFRERLLRTDMDRRLLERTVELARRTKAFDWKRLPATLRVAMDSSPFEGAGRVEDTVTRLGHAARQVVACAARLLGASPTEVYRAAGLSVLLAPSVKAGLDVDWTTTAGRAEALARLLAQVDALHTWLARHLPAAQSPALLAPPLAALAQIRQQNLEPDPPGGERLRQGVAKDRRVSVEEAERRHGRKSRHHRFTGYKRHLAADLDTDVILAGAVTPANRPEAEAVPALQADLARPPRPIGERPIDRGYVTSPVVDAVLDQGGEVLCKPWPTRARPFFPKTAFRLTLRTRTVTCPAGQTRPFAFGTVVEFEAAVCDRCPLRPQCTTAARGRTIAIADDERLQQRLRRLTATRSGRARLRLRAKIEHRLAHLTQRQGPRARYRGVRKNVFDVRRAAALQNLETVQRRLAAVQEAKAA